MSQTYGGAWWPLEAEMLVVDGEVVGECFILSPTRVCRRLIWAEWESINSL